MGERDGGAGRARRYASFVVQGWPRGAGGTLEIAHDQSGERIKATTLTEAINWMQGRAGASAEDAPVGAA